MKYVKKMKNEKYINKVQYIRKMNYMKLKKKTKIVFLLYYLFKILQQISSGL